MERVLNRMRRFERSIIALGVVIGLLLGVSFVKREGVIVRPTGAVWSRGVIHGFPLVARGYLHLPRWGKGIEAPVWRAVEGVLT